MKCGCVDVVIKFEDESEHELRLWLKGISKPSIG